jgi:hypothetical protein
MTSTDRWERLHDLARELGQVAHGNTTEIIRIVDAAERLFEVPEGPKEDAAHLFFDTLLEVL